MTDDEPITDRVTRPYKEVERFLRGNCNRATLQRITTSSLLSRQISKGIEKRVGIRHG